MSQKKYSTTRSGIHDYLLQARQQEMGTKNIQKYFEIWKQKAKLSSRNVNDHVLIEMSPKCFVTLVIMKVCSIGICSRKLWATRKPQETSLYTRPRFHNYCKKHKKACCDKSYGNVWEIAYPVCREILEKNFLKFRTSAD